MNRTFWNKPHIRRWAIFALLPLLAATLPLLLEASYRAYLNLMYRIFSANQLK